MGTKNLNSATDLITFSRNSKGTALRKISYGSELVTNGDFATDTSGWQARSSGILSVDSQRLKITNGGNNTGATRQLVSVTPNKTYKVSFSVFAGSVSTTRIFIGTTLGGSDLYTNYGFNATNQKFELFVSSSTGGISITVAVASFTQGDYFFYDNFSIKEVLYDQPDGTLQLFNHLDNTPRIEYNADGTVKGLLIEEARTNLLTYSEDFSTNSWASTNLSSGAGVTSPDGTTASDRLTATTNGSTHLYPSPRSSTTGVTYSTSVFAKANTHNIVQLNVPSTSSIFVNFDLTTGAKGTENNCTASIQSVGDGWYKCSITWVSASTSNSFGFSIVENITSGRTTSTTDGYSVDVYGAQVEAGAFPTSYIPTTGSTATRAADVASIPTDNFGYNSDAGTVLVEAQRFGTNNYPRSVMIDAGSESTSIGLGAWGPTTTLVGYIVSGGVVQAAPSTGAVGSSAFKNSFAYKENDFAASRDGGAVVTDTSGVVPTGLTTLRIGRNALNAEFLNGHIKSIKYYPRRLSNTQLQELTT